MVTLDLPPEKNFMMLCHLKAKGSRSEMATAMNELLAFGGWDRRVAFFADAKTPSWPHEIEPKNLYLVALFVFPFSTTRMSFSTQSTRSQLAAVV